MNPGQWSPGEVVSLALIVIGFIAWLVRLEARVSYQGVLHSDLKRDVVKELHYIRARVDELTGRRRRWDDPEEEARTGEYERRT